MTLWYSSDINGGSVVTGWLVRTEKNVHVFSFRFDISEKCAESEFAFAPI